MCILLPNKGSKTPVLQDKKCNLFYCDLFLTCQYCCPLLHIGGLLEEGGGGGGGRERLRNFHYCFL